MFSIIIICGLLVAASAAPRKYDRSLFSSEEDSISADDVFSIGWMDDLFKDLDRQMEALEREMKEMTKHLPGVDDEVKIDNNKYKLKLHLSGFNENEISVKAKQGSLLVEAQSRNNSQNTIILRSLPSNVDWKGQWTYENGVLSIVFPITTSGSDTVSNVDFDIRTNTNSVNNVVHVNKDNTDRLNEIPPYKTEVSERGPTTENLKDQVELVSH